MGNFDPSTFLDVNVTDANATESIPVPEGEYVAVCGEPTVRPWNSRDGSKSGLALDLLWTVDDPGVKSATGRDTNIVKQGIMLDLNGSGGIDTGKGMNVALGRLRAAVGLNVPGKPFNFRMLAGQVARVSVKHRVDGEQVFADVKGVAPLS